MFKEILTYENGTEFQQYKLENHVIDFVDNSSDILFITFDSLFPNVSIDLSERYPWAGKYLIEQGYNLLGVKTNYSNWYRSKDLYKALLGANVQDILKRHKRVIFYGDSMGAYAALAFSSIIPDAEILCYAPQTTLDEKITPWDDRYTKYGRKADWTGKFKDAARELKTTKRACIIYDPFDRYDPKHIARLPQDKITKLKAPFLDHEVSSYISGFDLMKPTVDRFIDGTLEEWWPKAIRIRKTSNVYLSNVYYHLSMRAVRQHDLDKAIHYAEQSLKQNIKNKRAVEFAKLLIQKKTKGYASAN